MAQIINGKEIAAQIHKEVAEGVAQFKDKSGGKVSKE